MSINPLEIPEIIILVLNHVIDIRPCKLNNMWLSLVKNHDDYQKFWNVYATVNDRNIAKCGMPKMLQLCRNKSSALIHAATYGNMEFVRYVLNAVDVADIIVYEAYICACANYHMIVASYLYDHLPLAAFVEMSGKCRVTGPVYTFIKYAIERIEDDLNVLHAKNLFDTVARDVIIEVIHSIVVHDHNGNILVQIMHLITATGNLELFKHVYKIFARLNHRSVMLCDSMAAIEGHVHMLEYLKSMGPAFCNDYNMYNDVMSTANVESLKYICCNTLLNIREQELIKAVKVPFINIIDYLWSDHYTICRRWAHILMKHALKYVNVFVVRYLYEHDVPIHIDHITACFDEHNHYLIKRRLNVLQLIKYLYRKRVNLTHVYNVIWNLACRIDDVKIIRFMVRKVMKSTTVDVIALMKLAKYHVSYNVLQYFQSLSGVDILNTNSIKLNNIAEHDYKHIIKYGHKCSIEQIKYTCVGAVFVWCAMYDNRTVLSLLFDNYCIDVQHVILAYIYACCRGHAVIAQILREYIPHRRCSTSKLHINTIHQTIHNLRRRFDKSEFDYACANAHCNKYFNKVMTGGEFMAGHTIIQNNAKYKVHARVRSKFSLGNLLVVGKLTQALLAYRIGSSDIWSYKKFMVNHYNAYFERAHNDITYIDYDVICGAIQCGSVDVVRYLHSCGANLRKYGDGLLMWACKQHNLEVVKYLCENGADVDACNSMPVKLAIGHNNLELIKLLHTYGAHIDVPGQTLMLYAASRDRTEIVKYFHQCGISIRLDNNVIMAFACKNGNCDLVKYLHKNGIALTDELLALVTSNDVYNAKLALYFARHNITNKISRAMISH